MVWPFLAFAAAAIAQTPAPSDSQAAVATPRGQVQTKIAPESGPDQSWSFELYYWVTQAHPDLRGGAAATDFESLNLPGNSRPAPGGELSVRINSNDVLRFSGFQMSGTGNTTASQALDLFGTTISSGDYLATQYRVSALKLSFEDLLYPFPVKGAKLRFKTLWEAQAAKINSRIDAPYDTSTSPYPSATGTRYVFLPAFGGAIQYAASEHVYLEVRASGFGIPHHADTLDSEASVGYRIGQVQVVLGGKLYEFKTSPKNAEYFKGMITGGFIGLRWVGQQ